MKCAIRVLMTLLLFPVAVLSGPNGSDSEPEVVLIVNADGNFQLNAIQAPLGRILERIKQNTDIALNYTSLAEDLTSVSCSGTIVELMNCVLGGTNNLMMRYGERPLETANAALPEEIWILGSSDYRKVSEFEDGAFDGLCGASRSASFSTGKGEKHNGLLTPEAKDTLLKQMRSQDLSARTEAIARLASLENDGEVLDSLREALSDDNPIIRAQAVSTLAARKVSGANRILQQALLDPNAEVRLMAVDHAGDDESLLLTALDDADKNVRLLANLKLEQLYNPHRNYGANQY